MSKDEVPCHCAHFLFNIQAPLIIHDRFLIVLHISEHLCGFSERKDNPAFLSSGDQSSRLTSQGFVFLSVEPNSAIIIVLCNSGDTHLTGPVWLFSVWECERQINHC